MQNHITFLVVFMRFYYYNSFYVFWFYKKINFLSRFLFPRRHVANLRQLYNKLKLFLVTQWNLKRFHLLKKVGGIPSPFRSGLTHPNAAFIESVAAPSLCMHSSWFTNQQCRLMKEAENKLVRPYIYSIINPPYHPSCCILCYSKDGCRFLPAKLFSKRFTGRTKIFFFVTFVFFFGWQRFVVG